MNGIVITDSGRFEQVITSFEESFNKVKDIFANEKRNAEEINETDTWSGGAAKVMYDKYKKLSDNFQPIEYSLELYIKFLKKTLEDYRRIEEEINKNMEDFSESLNVNS